MKVFKEAIRLTIPVMIGYLFLGMAFGILCQKQGYSMIWAFLISLTVYAGSMQFVLLTFFHSGISLVEIAMVTLTVNARQLFYGLSFLNVFPKMGKKKWYMIFSLSDETYSLLCAIPNKDSTENKRLMFYISFLDQVYWILGSIIGASVGSIIPFDTTGIDFAMTALFTVIFVEQWLAAKRHTAVYFAFLAIVISAVFFHLSNFLLPALILLVIFLIIFQDKVEEEGVHERNK